MPPTTLFLAPSLMALLCASACAQVIITPNNTGSSLGVTVVNSGSSGGNAEISNAGNGNANVDLRDNFDGDVSGINDGDTVITGSNVTADIDASGGEVVVAGSGCTVKVSNADDAEEDVVIRVPGDDGDTVIVLTPGNSTTITT